MAKAFWVRAARNQPLALGNVPHPSRDLGWNQLSTGVGTTHWKPPHSPKIHSPKLWGLFPNLHGLGPLAPGLHSLCGIPVARKGIEGLSRRRHTAYGRACS